jgi:hypothetical protein
MRSLVARVQKELEGQQGKKKTLNVKGGKKARGKVNAKSNMRINKCWNTIRFIAECEYFADKFLNIVEDTLLPLFEYLVTPD